MSKPAIMKKCELERLIAVRRLHGHAEYMKQARAAGVTDSVLSYVDDVINALGMGWEFEKPPQSSGNHIKCLSIRAPWIHCILHLGKRIENRVWSTSYRGPILLHRAKALSKREHRDALAWIGEHVSHEVASRVPSYSEMRLVDRGAIVGIADLVACERNGGLWTPEEQGSWRMAGQWGFRLENVRAFQESVFHRGALQFFGVDEALVEAAIAGAVPCEPS